MSGDDLLGELLLVLAFLDVRAVEPLHVVLSKTAGHGRICSSSGRTLLEQRRLDDARGLCRGVAVVFEDVPAAEHQIVERRQRHHVADLRRPALGPFAEANRAHLRQRADGLGKSFANGEHAGDGRRADGAEADEQHAELAARRSNVDGRRHELRII